jgi:hypothetical protein
MFAMRFGIPTVLIFSYVIAQDVDYSQFVNPFIGSEGAIPGYACKLSSTKIQDDANML